MGSGVKQQGKQAVAALMAFLGERRRLEGDVCGKDLQRALWTDPPKVRIMPGIPRKLDYQGRMKYKKDCDEVFPQIMIELETVSRILTISSILGSHTSSTPLSQRLGPTPPNMPSKASATRVSAARTCLGKTFPSTSKSVLSLSIVLCL